MKFIIVTILLLLTFTLGKTQFTDVGKYFVHSPVVYNPAAAGINNVFTIQYNNYNQWLGLDGAPSYNNFAFHTPMPKDRIALGLTLHTQSIGISNITSGYFNYALRLPLQKTRLSLGFRAGANSQNQDQPEEELASDQAFMGDKFFIPNFGLGVVIYSPKYLLGISIPELFLYNYHKKSIGHDINNYSYYTLAWYKQALNNYIFIKPAVLYKYNRLLKSQLNADLSVTAFEKYMAGIIYKGIKGRGEKLDSYSALVMFRANPQTDIGLAYEINNSPANKPSFEVFVQYQFNYKIKVSSPRNF